MSGPIIIDDIEQGSGAWSDARRGNVTATGASRIITPTGKLSAQREEYMAQLLAEWAIGQPLDQFEGNYWTERGHEMEPRALQYFAFITDLTARKVGVVFRDESRLVACSPDFMVGTEPGELKCPMATRHVMYLLSDGVPRQYRIQTQFQVWCCQSKRGHFMSYYPELPEHYVEYEPDEALHKAFNTHIPLFVEEMLEGREKLRQMGVVVDERL